MPLEVQVVRSGHSARGACLRSMEEWFASAVTSGPSPGPVVLDGLGFPLVKVY